MKNPVTGLYQLKAYKTFLIIDDNNEEEHSTSKSWVWQNKTSTTIIWKYTEASHIQTCSKSFT